MKTIDIDELKQGLPGITQSVGNYLSEAVIYCLISNGHDSGVLMAIEGESEENVKIESLVGNIGYLQSIGKQCGQ